MLTILKVSRAVHNNEGSYTFKNAFQSEKMISKILEIIFAAGAAYMNYILFWFLAVTLYYVWLNYFLIFG